MCVCLCVAGCVCGGGVGRGSGCVHGNLRAGRRPPKDWILAGSSHCQVPCVQCIL